MNAYKETMKAAIDTGLARIPTPIYRSIFYGAWNKASLAISMGYSGMEAAKKEILHYCPELSPKYCLRAETTV